METDSPIIEIPRTETTRISKHLIILEVEATDMPEEADLTLTSRKIAMRTVQLLFNQAEDAVNSKIEIISTKT